MSQIYKNFQLIVGTFLLTILLLGSWISARADTVSTPPLIISQIKVTSSSGQFVTLYNSTDKTLDMSKFQLEYFNHYDLSKATSSRLIPLSVTLPPHGYFMINDNAMLLCYRLTVDAVSLGFSSTAGMISVLSLEQTSSGGIVTPAVLDYVGWSKTQTSSAQVLPTGADSFLQRQPADFAGNPNITFPGSGSWQAVKPSSDNPCDLVATESLNTVVATGMNQLLPASGDIPSTIVNVSSSGLDAPSIPISDIGLKPPAISELLPNPKSTGNDKTSEFIELYNSNSKIFDLSGFILQTGLAKAYNYTFPKGTKIAPKGFLTIYSETSKLTLSNTSGQARLLDPFGNNLITSGVYGPAKDGISWASANNKWYWTTTATPGKPNIINEPSPKSSTKKGSAKVKGASTSKNIGGVTSSSSGFEDEPKSNMVHTGVLVLIAGLALLYGAYEYRVDLANKFFQFKRHFSNRRANRS